MLFQWYRGLEEFYAEESQHVTAENKSLGFRLRQRLFCGENGGFL